MKNFIVSDLHGNGLVYKHIINYLSNLSDTINEDITLYINGDLIDRGYASTKMLLDIKNKIEYGNKFRIEYLAGNHELMLYQAFNDYEKYGSLNCVLWMSTGGGVTINGLTKKFGEDMSKFVDLRKFIGNLKIYHKFKETINNKNIVLVHAKCPLEVSDNCTTRIKDNDYIVNNCVWDRKDFGVKIGNNDYFTIIGHTPVNNEIGCLYDKGENTLNIDGGNAPYACGLYEFDHTPLIEVENEKLSILTFNNSNEISVGKYFINDSFIGMDKVELKEKRYLLRK